MNSRNCRDLKKEAGTKVPLYMEMYNKKMEMNLMCETEGVGEYRRFVYKMGKIYWESN
jgi:hypothetical protein